MKFNTNTFALISAISFFSSSSANAADLKSHSNCSIEGSTATCTTYLNSKQYCIEHNAKCAIKTSFTGYSYLDCSTAHARPFSAFDSYSGAFLDVQLFASHKGRALKISHFEHHLGGIKSTTEYLPINDVSLLHPKYSKQIKEALESKTLFNRIRILMFVLAGSMSLITLFIGLNKHR